MKSTLQFLFFLALAVFAFEGAAGILGRESAILDFLTHVGFLSTGLCVLYGIRALTQGIRQQVLWAIGMLEDEGPI